MRLQRKDDSGALFFISLAICLLAPFSLAHSKDGPLKTAPLNGIAPSSKIALRVSPHGTDSSRFAHTGHKGRHAGFEVFFCKARTILPEDTLSKLMHIENTAVFEKCIFRPSGPFRCLIAGQAPLRGFLSSFTGLSPPSV